jgi:hypothetical protein
MNWQVRLVLVGAVAAFGALLPAVADSPRPEAPARSHHPDRTVVRVEHELVPATVVQEAVVQETVVAEAVGQGTVVAEAVGQGTVVAEAVEKKPAGLRVRRLDYRNTRPDGFASRARQLLIGDGRYRPEPFPRVGGQ